MKLYVFVKGNVAGKRRWEEELGAVKLPFKYKKEKALIRIGVRPIQLYEIGFPEDHLDTVLSVIGIRKDGSYILNRYPVMKKAVKWMRKFLSLKPCPNPKTIIEHMQPNQVDKAVAVIPISIKEDKTYKGFEHI